MTMADRPKILWEALEMCRGKRGQLCIGVKSGYVFIGSIEEWDRDASLLDMYFRELERQKFEADRKAVSGAHDVFAWTPFEARSIRRIYHRNVPREPAAQIAIILEGNEHGDCGTYSDYPQTLPRMYEKCCKWYANDPFDRIPDAWLPRFFEKEHYLDGTDKGFTNLAFAIIHRACDDYKRSYMSLLNAQKKRSEAKNNTKEARTAKAQITSSTGEMKTLEKWFSGLWCELLGDGIDTATIPFNIRNMVDNERQEESPCK